MPLGSVRCVRSIGSLRRRPRPQGSHGSRSTRSGHNAATPGRRTQPLLQTRALVPAAGRWALPTIWLRTDSEGMAIEQHQHVVRSIVEDPRLTYRQRIQSLALAAENVLEPPAVSDACALALEKGLICDMAEGHAPYRPRYTLPDYEIGFAHGSAFLE